MKSGTVKWYNEIKGFGFIVTDDGEDIFVHRTGIVNPRKTLQPGQKVDFETSAGEKGTIAIEVRPSGE